MPHLKREAKRVRAQLQEIFQERSVALEVWRQLHQDRPQVTAFAQDRSNFEKPPQCALAVAQTLDMRDLLVGLERKLETFRNALRPLLDHALRRHTVEGIVDLHGRKLLAVERQHLLVGEFRRVEVALPLFVGIPGSADAKLARSRNRPPPESRQKPFATLHLSTPTGKHKTARLTID